MSPDSSARVPVARIDDIAFAYDGREVVSGISFSIGPGEVVALFGPNGCGKSTVLRMLGGRLSPSAGRMEIPRRGEIGFVFQNYRDSLFPWSSALANAAFPLECRGIDHRSARAAAEEALTLVGARDHAEAFPYRLSGGQAQAVAIARAIIARPKLVLLDEPSSALDIVARRDLWIALEEVIRQSEAGFLLVTHDLDEAVMLADRVLVMTPRPGRITRELAIDMPRPRGPHLLSEPRFLERRAELARAFEEALAS